MTRLHGDCADHDESAWRTLQIRAVLLELGHCTVHLLGQGARRTSPRIWRSELVRIDRDGPLGQCTLILAAKPRLAAGIDRIECEHDADTDQSDTLQLLVGKDETGIGRRVTDHATDRESECQQRRDIGMGIRRIAALTRRLPRLCWRRPLDERGASTERDREHNSRSRQRQDT